MTRAALVLPIVLCLSAPAGAERTWPELEEQPLDKVRAALQRDFTTCYAQTKTTLPAGTSVVADVRVLGKTVKVRARVNLRFWRDDAFFTPRAAASLNRCVRRRFEPRSYFVHGIPAATNRIALLVPDAP